MDKLCIFAYQLLSDYADNSFCYQLEMKQRYLVGKMNVPDEKEGGPDEVTMETLGKDSSLNDAYAQPFFP